MSEPIHVRPAMECDQEDIWRILKPVIRAGETYPLPPGMSKQQALEYWFSPSHQVFVAKHGLKTSGTYYIRPNNSGGGSHVANCGYMVCPEARGQGIASAMYEHSEAFARDNGYAAIQFNFVIATNPGAIRLWQKFGFQTVGRLPGAFRHPEKGLVDALVMFKSLRDSQEAE